MKEKAVPKRDTLKRRFQNHPVFSSALTRRILLYAAYFLAGMVCSRGVVFGRYAPFGVAAVAAGPYSTLWAMALGCIGGYLWPSAVHAPVRYIAAILAIVAIRWTLNDVLKIRTHPLFSPLVTFVPLIATGMTMGLIDGSTTQTWVLYIAESLLGGCGAYFFSRSSVLILGKKGVGALNQVELACVILTAGILVLSLSSITIGVISIGRVAAVLLILFSCRYGGVIGGSISGIVAGAMFGLSTSGISGISGALAFAGLMAGLFSPLGRVATVLVFIVANGLGTLQVGSYASLLNGLYEVMAATLIFVVWPNRTGSRFAAIFKQPEGVARSDGLRRSVIMKLGFAAAALENVSESVESVSERLAKVCAPSVQGVYQKAVEETCTSCGLKGYCWGNKQGNHMEWMQELTEPLRRKGKVERGDFPQKIAEHCSRLGEMAGNVNKNYQEFLSKESAERRVAQVRNVVTDQFSTTGRMLKDMANELELFEKFDFPMAQKIQEALHELSISPMDVSCRLDRYDRMFVEVEAPALDKSRLKKSNVIRTLSRVTGRIFDRPCISVAQDKCRFQVGERPVYQASFGIAQHSCANGSLCGDSYESFLDGTGRYISIISDGMGTGGRAAVDGAMASSIMATLIKAGVGFDCALKITNSALMVKSGEETLSTLDVAAVDLFDGKVELMKAGAPISFVKREGKVDRLDAVSLPVGILEEAVFSRVSTQIGAGDVLVMFSDGVVASGESWVSDTLESWKEGEPKELANLLMEKAMKNRTDGHDDDITVLVVKLSHPHMEVA